MKTRWKMKSKSIDWYLWKGERSISGNFRFPVDFVMKADKEYVFFLTECKKDNSEQPDYRLSLVESKDK